MSLIARARQTPPPKPAPAPAPGTTPAPASAPGSLDLDPAQPLEEKRAEWFAHLVAGGMKPRAAYQKTAPAPISAIQTARECSGYANRPDIAARVQYLRKGANDTPPQSAPASVETVLTRAEILQKLTAVVRLGGSDASFVSACVQAAKLLEADADKEAAPFDPVEFARHLTSFAGQTGEDICRQAGGLRFLVNRFLELTKVSPDDIRAALVEIGLTPHLKND